MPQGVSDTCAILAHFAMRSGKTSTPEGARAERTALAIREPSLTLPQVQDLAVDLACPGKACTAPAMAARPAATPPAVCLVHAPGFPRERIADAFAGTSGGTIDVRPREAALTDERARRALLECPPPARLGGAPSPHSPPSSDPAHWPEDPSLHCLSSEELSDCNFPLPSFRNGQLTAPSGFACVQPRGGGVALSDAPHVAALDCEMVSTSSGLELARVSLVSTNGSVILDELVQPDNTVCDHLTAFSGITEGQLASATATKSSIQSKLLQLVADDTVLVGHSLEGDLHHVGLVHPLVMDTAILFPNPKGFPFKSSLKSVAKRYMLKDIQTQGANGHDSVEDARESLQLALLKLTNGVEFASTEPNRVPLPEKLKSRAGGHSIKTALVARKPILRRYGSHAEHHPTKADAEAPQAAAYALRNGCKFLFVDLVDVSYAQDSRERRERDAAEGLTESPDREQEDVAIDQKIQECESTFSRIRCTLPEDSILLICSSHVCLHCKCTPYFSESLHVSRFEKSPDLQSARAGEFCKVETPQRREGQKKSRCLWRKRTVGNDRCTGVSDYAGKCRKGRSSSLLYWKLTEYDLEWIHIQISAQCSNCCNSQSLSRMSS